IFSRDWSSDVCSSDLERSLRALATVKDPKAPIEERIRATKLLSAQQNAALVNEIPKLMADDRLRLEAIRAIAAYDNENLGSLLRSEERRVGQAWRYGW